MIRDLFAVSEPESVKQELVDISKNLQEMGGLTIDEWLEVNPAHSSKVKAIIAYLISAFESNDATKPARDWISYLWRNCLFPGCRNPNDMQKNNIVFITFNYDRSLEHYLYKVIRNSFTSAKEDEIREAARGLNIIHVYGKIGFLPWEDTKQNHSFICEYEKAASPKESNKISQMINIISDEKYSDSTLDSCREHIQSAEKICFLGFGYHDDNMKKLFPAELCKDLQDKQMRKQVEIIGSFLKLGDSRYRELRDAKRSSYKFEIWPDQDNTSDHKYNAYELLDNVFLCK